jgi:hypothetical protein
MNDFTLIKIGNPEKISDSLKGVFSSSIFVRSNLREDSLVVIIKQTDSLEVDYNSRPLVYKLKIPDSLKIAFINFYNYAINLKNGALPGHNYEEPIIYSGGQFIIAFKDSINNEHYYGYILKDLSVQTQTFHDLLDNLCLNILSKNNLREIIYINTDSITTALCEKEGMEKIIPIVPFIEGSPIRFQ